MSRFKKFEFEMEPFGKLVMDRIVLAYHEPIIFVMKDENGENVLFWQHTRDSKGSVFLINYIDENKLIQFIFGEVALQYVFSNKNNTCYSLSETNEGKRQLVNIEGRPEIFEKYNNLIFIPKKQKNDNVE